ncbi:hypothetical protein BKA56DRAFT_702716 [Ilyonectria sp. MPI-CAGE-AT-0026]|nr:hypothetical protein BKA56DRAFT_702716 [Ilyonectria sp. MPI-CAGE-AT-0026]
MRSILLALGVVSLAPNVLGDTGNPAVAAILYKDVNFGGSIYTIYNNRAGGNCINKPGGVDYMSSFRIRKGYTCRFFDNSECNPNFGVLDNQTEDVADLRNIGWNDRIASMLCYS